MLLPLKPFCDNLGTGMNVNLPQRSLTRIDERVGNTSRPDHDMPAIHFERALTHGKSSMTLQDHKDLFIRMLVQSGALPRRRLHPEKRNGDTSMFSSLKHMARELLSGNDVSHVLSPLRGTATLNGESAHTPCPVISSRTSASSGVGSPV